MGLISRNYSGFFGLRRLFKQLRKLNRWDGVIDLHSVMRTWVLGSFFKLSGVKVFSIDKGRKEKAELVNKTKKTFKQLKHTTERYLDVFRDFGLKASIQEGAVIKPKVAAVKRIEDFLGANGIKSESRSIGIAPFSKHKQKTWPYAKTKSLIEHLLADDQNQIFLLGGPEESRELQELATPYKRCWNMAGMFSLEEEIALMYQLDVVVAMDSFNMHLAALCNTKVVSIWGGTHKYAGFGPLNSNEQNIVEISHEDLTCRPCSVFGSTPCFRKDWACLEEITATDVLAKLA
jgi:ADP-heptose:LPS heptosyltransferase